jgi:hypothetical protein
MPSVARLACISIILSPCRPHIMFHRAKAEYSGGF